MAKTHEELINLLKVIREVDDLEIKDYALESLIERLEEEKNRKTIKKDKIEKQDFKG